MIRRIIGAALVVLAVVAAGIGIVTATVFAPSSSSNASMPGTGTPIVLVEPGVLGLLSDTVTVTATASDPELPVLLAFAPTSDVEAWVAGAAHTSVTGLESWDALKTETVEGESEVPNPAGADLWRDELQGVGKLVVEITPDPGQVTLLAATDGTAPAPQLTLTWPVESGSTALVPLLVTGGVLLLAGIAVLAYDAARRSTEKAQATSREVSDRLQRANLTQTEALSAVDSDGPRATFRGRLTRRQLRERENEERATDPRYGSDGPFAVSGGAIGAGIVPGVTDPERFRALRHVDLDDDEAEPAPSRADLARFAPPGEEPAGGSQDRSEALAAAGPAAGAGILPDSLRATEERAAADRAAAGGTQGAGVLPGRSAAADRAAAGGAHGAGILPGRSAAAAESSDTSETDVEDRQETPRASASWRDLWGFRSTGKTDPTEDQR